MFLFKRVLLAFVLLCGVVYGGDKSKTEIFRYENLINSSLSAMKQGFEFKIKKIKEDNGESSGELVATGGKNIVVSVVADDNGVKRIFFAGGGEGSAKSALELMAAAVSAILAIEDPFVSKEERGKVFRLINLKKITKGESNSFEYRGFDFSSSFSSLTGLVITGERKE